MKTTPLITISLVFVCIATVLGEDKQTQSGPIVHVRPWERLGPRPAPELAGLKAGMTVKEFERILGVKGAARPNAGPDEAIVDFDFDQKWILVTVPGWLPGAGKNGSDPN